MTLDIATAARPDGTDNTPRVVLSARGLRRDFAGFVAVKDVDLDVHHARIHALIGPNGAGKTTIFNLLTEFLQPTSGRIELLGTDITRTPPAKVARMGLVRSFQISAIFPHLSVLDNVRVALQRPGGLGYQFWRSVSALDQLTPRARELLAIVGLDDAGRDRIPTGVVSIGDFANWLKLSRTHLARKLRDAEELGSLGWLGQRGHSVMWVSSDFHREYMTAQAVKLAIIDAAFEEALGPAPSA